MTRLHNLLGLCILVGCAGTYRDIKINKHLHLKKDLQSTGRATQLVPGKYLIAHYYSYSRVKSRSNDRIHAGTSTREMFIKVVDQNLLTPKSILELPHPGLEITYISGGGRAWQHFKNSQLTGELRIEAYEKEKELTIFIRLQAGKKILFNQELNLEVKEED